MKIGSVESTQENSRFNNLMHVVIGSIYGLLIGTSFVLMWAFIDTWLYPDLPLGVDWQLTAMRWAWIGMGLALVGGLTCLFSETWAGLMAGGVSAGLLALLSGLAISSVSAGLKVIVLVFMLVPISVTSLPIAWILRRLAEWHAHILHQKQSVVRIGLVVLIAVALGMGAGYFTRMPGRAVLAVRLLHDTLRAPPESKDKALSELPRLREHADVSYELFQKASEESTEGFEVRAEYEDGYRVQCVVVAYPGSHPYIRDCKEIER